MYNNRGCAKHILKRVSEMIKIVIVDDSRDDFNSLNACLTKYQEEKGFIFNISYFSSPLEFLDSNFSDVNLLFLDIDMPDINGIELSKKIREKNGKIGIVFVTNYFEYALEGYEVEAIDYILKPLVYQRFLIKMNRIIKIVKHIINDYSITIKTKFKNENIHLNEIIYIEIEGHYLNYYLTNGNVLKERGKLSNALKELDDYGFKQANTYCLINLRHVNGINKNEVDIGDKKIQLSRSKKSSFINELTKYTGENI